MTFWRKIWKSKPQPEVPMKDWALPEGALVYAIGDIHGRFDLLQKLLTQIEEDRTARWGVENTYIVFLGDYVDRGFQSYEVIEYLANYAARGVTPIFLRGNHEELMLRFMEDPVEAQLWLSVGGPSTLVSYGIDLQSAELSGDILMASDMLIQKMPEHHLRFLKNLQTSWRLGDYFFVHAGLRPGVPLKAQRAKDLTTIRQDFTQSRHNFGVCVVHGHTGVKEPEHVGNRIGVDTGAFATGVLTAVVLEGEEVRFLATT
ncbi:metallophosphoesterase family protein [Kordiimonas sp.]|uniref:metallophosphoesterase family protein n=1 Tax=Kordiimonas sp. TaxID=1970157 RepID=UPI003A93A00A